MDDAKYPSDAIRILDELADQYDMEFLTEANGGACASRQMAILGAYRRGSALPPFPRASRKVRPGSKDPEE